MMRLASISSSTKLRTICSPSGPGFFGMELHAEDVAVFEHRGVGQRVGAGGGGRVRSPGRSSCGRNRRTGCGRQVAQQLRRRATARVRFQPMCGTRASVRKALHGAWEDAEAADFRGLLAGLEQRLQAETDAQKRHAGARCARAASRARCSVVERAHHLAEMADAGQDDLGGGAQACGIAHQRVRRSRSRPACSARCADCRRRNRRWRS